MSSWERQNSHCCNVMYRGLDLYQNSCLVSGTLYDTEMEEAEIRHDLACVWNDLVFSTGLSGAIINVADVLGG